MTGNTTETFFPYTQQNIDAADIKEVSKILQSSMITRGPQVEAFEQAVASYCGAKFAVAFSTGTSALQAAYYAAELSPFDRVITTPISFVATIASPIQKGNPIVFLDIDKSTGNLDLTQLKEELNYCPSRGRNFIVPVHYSGIPVDMEMLERQINDIDTVVIEDAAHALGASYSNGKKVGCCEHSQMTMFSFHPAKNITTGEGGMITTNDEKLYRRLQRFRNNGIERDPANWGENPGPWYYEVQDITGNHNFTEIQAALGLSQLGKLDKFNQKRNQIVAWYRKKLAKIPHVTLAPESTDALSAHHLFVVQIDFEACGKSRTEVMTKLRENHVGTQVHYVPLYRHPVIKEKSGDLTADYPNTEEFYSKILSFPLYPGLKEKNVNSICQALKDILST